jgi:hypothetical protein
MAAQTFMTSAITPPPMKTMSFLRGGMYCLPYLTTVPFVCSNKVYCPDQVFQDVGSYLHDVSKNGTTDEDHVHPPRRNVFATILSCKQCFQDGGSYLHDVSKSGTADEDHVLSPRRNVLFTLHLSSAPIMRIVQRLQCYKMAANTFMTSARTAPLVKTMSFLHGGKFFFTLLALTSVHLICSNLRFQ